MLYWNALEKTEQLKTNVRGPLSHIFRNGFNLESKNLKDQTGLSNWSKPTISYAFLLWLGLARR